MKVQVKSFSPHQNAKVVSILMAISVSIFMVPFWLISFGMLSRIPETDHSFGMFRYMVFIFPFLYLIVGYLSITVGAMVYNFMNKFIGGFEFETVEQAETANPSPSPEL